MTDYLDQAVALLKLDEGTGPLGAGGRLMPYNDATGETISLPSGDLTLGYGRNVQAEGIREIEADFMLSNDVFDCDQELRGAFYWYPGLSDARKAVLINMHYKMGLRRLRLFARMLRALSAGEWSVAAHDIVDSDFGRGKTRRRAERLAEIMRTDNWLDSLRF